MSKKRTKTVRTTISAGDALAQARDEIEALREEMTSWADNIEEHFSGTERYERVRSAADTLDGLDVPDEGYLTDYAQGETVEVSVEEAYKGSSLSRAARAANAAGLLNTAAEALRNFGQRLRDFHQEHEDKIEAAKGEEGEEATSAINTAAQDEFGLDFDDLESAADECDSVADNAEDVASEIEQIEFPSMMG